jgi:hypothetical protein
LRPRVPPELVAPFDRLGEVAVAARLQEAGLTNAESGLFSWHYEFSSEEALWEFVSGPGVFSRQFSVIGEEDKKQMRSEVAASLAAYRQQHGYYRIPHTCRLWWGCR